MDFHSLSRKELQALCKRNKILANMTNAAMADALHALQTAEGLDELMNQCQTGLPQSPTKTTTGSPVMSRTATRTSTRRKPVNEEPQSLQPTTRTRRVTRRAVLEERDQENVNMLLTPATRTSRRKAQGALAHQQSETLVIEDEEKEKNVGEGQSDLLRTPAVQTCRRRAAAASSRRKGAESQRRVYSTRRSVRLLEKTMGELSLKENEETNIDQMDKDTVEESLDVSGPSENFDQISKHSGQTNESEATSGKILPEPLENEMDLNENIDVNGVQDCKKNSIDLDDYSVLDANDETQNNKADEPDARAHVIEDLVNKIEDLDGALAGCDDAPVSEFSSKLKSVCDSSTIGEDVSTTENLALEYIGEQVSDHVADEVPPEELNANDGELLVVNPTTLPLSGCDDAPVTEFSSELNSLCEALMVSEESNVIEDIVLELEVLDHVANAVPPEELNAVGEELPTVLNPSIPPFSGDDPELDKQFQPLQREEMVGENIQSDSDTEKFMAHRIDIVESSDEISTADNDLGNMEVYNSEQRCPLKTTTDAHIETSVEGSIVSGEEPTLTTNVFPPLPDPASNSHNWPFAPESVPGQFPRPTLSTPIKSSSKKQTAMQKLTHMADKNKKENIDKVKKVKNITDAENLKDRSLRQLLKMVKELEISKNMKSEAEEGKGRVALQTLTENSMRTAEPEKK